MNRIGPAKIIAGIAFGICALLLIAPPQNMPVPLAHVAALTVFSIGFWATGAWPEHVTAVAFFVGAMLLGVASPTVVFSGFASSALWLVFAGLVFGVAIKRTGLGERLARSLVGRIGHSYAAVIAGVVAVAIVLAFLMPSSMGRVVLFIPIVSALADALGFEAHSRGRTGMVMAAGLSCFIPGAAILPAAVPNLVLIGAAETQFQMHFAYLDYLLLQFPVIGLLGGGLIVGLTCLFYYEPPRAMDLPSQQPPMTAPERRLAIILAGALVLWVTDFVHGISPAWIGLGASLLCLLPRSDLVSPKVFGEQVNFGPMLYVAGILGMAAVIADSGLGKLVGDYFLAWAPLAPGADAGNFAALVGISALTGLITTMAGVPAILTPFADNLSAATGMSLYAVIMTQVMGYATLFVPYESPPLVVAMQLGGVRVAQALRLTVTNALLFLIVLLPINFLWWLWLGMFSVPAG